jgi:hypothetical protein
MDLKVCEATAILASLVNRHKLSPQIRELRRVLAKQRTLARKYSKVKSQTSDIMKLINFREDIIDDPIIISDTLYIQYTIRMDNILECERQIDAITESVFTNRSTA